MPTTLAALVTRRYVMAERDPLTEENKGIEQTRVDDQEATGAKVAAEGAGNPDVPSVGNRAESHHIAHAGSKQGEREDEQDVEDSGDELHGRGMTDPTRINPIADEENPPGQPAADRPQVEEARGDRVTPGQERNVA
jgi:hypothetical protein